MSKPVPSTPSKSRKYRADIYRKAAASMEGGADPSPYSCDHIWRVCVSRFKEDSSYEGLRDAYKAEFSGAEWWDQRGDGYFSGQPVVAEWREERILALCFMAAMVEAGDA